MKSGAESLVITIDGLFDGQEMHLNLWYFVITFALILLFRRLGIQRARSSRFPTVEFEQLLVEKSANREEIWTSARIRLGRQLKQPKDGRRFLLPPGSETDLADRI